MTQKLTVTSEILVSGCGGSVKKLSPKLMCGCLITPSFASVFRKTLKKFSSNEFLRFWTFFKDTNVVSRFNVDLFVVF